jgi:hypothetical protein
LEGYIADFEVPGVGYDDCGVERAGDAFFA